MISTTAPSHRQLPDLHSLVVRPIAYSDLASDSVCSAEACREPWVSSVASEQHIFDVLQKLLNKHPSLEGGFDSVCLNVFSPRPRTLNYLRSAFCAVLPFIESIRHNNAAPKLGKGVGV
ncbi:hypothetical protein [Pandoraea sp. ISTKB]|uniref:hypothetical protein n=1 Tax=Pandoraea sp. ISTKB TaxID=1586708 RepID=UPI001113001B|nr:hypothetical protein [Pandoraea sp. ISTKB]